MKPLRAYWRKLKGGDKGTVAVTFLLSLPLLLLIFGVIVQYALLANGRIVVDRAAAAAGRTAMTCLPTDQDVDKVDGVALINRSARMALEPISPKATEAITVEASDVATSLESLGLKVPNDFAQRFTYATAATIVEWARVDDNGVVIAEPAWQTVQFARSHGQRVQITVKYDFLLTVPGVRMWIGRSDTIGGVAGRYVTFTATYILETSHGRQAQSGSSGVPF